jgi:pimeloyl-ACP methyl ester carboxylesterase
VCSARVLLLLAAAVAGYGETYVSRVDGSTQPYRVHLPANYDAAKPMRLDVILHGRNAKITPESFLAAKPHVVTDRIELEVYGRGNNAYRWAGETDVMEAIGAVRAKYKIDPDRIVLRGFSMGGAGTWHLGLHHPSLWAAIEAGAGFTETIVYAKRTQLTPVERAGLRIYDAVDYAPNIQLVPAVGYGGELDPQLKASQNIKEAVADLTGLRALWLVGPKTEHKWHPESKAASEAFLAQHLPRKANDPYRFVTFTPRFGDGRIEALETMYQSATIEQTGSTVTTKNVAMLRLPAGSYTIDGQKQTGTVFHKADGRWRKGEPKGLIKRAGLQGPIDDAFMDRFVSIGEPDATFAANWKRHMNGELLRAEGPVNDAHLVLWGTPETNPTLKKVLPKLPIQWAAGKLTVNGQTFDAATHALAMIYPNPLNPAKYVVLNSGHTFGTKDFEGTNALLYPRYGDYAVIEKASGAVKLSGYFDSRWRFANP